MADITVEFDRPPVVEVALSVQFEAVEGLSTGHLGLLWDRYRDRFPVCSEQPALEPVVERFDAATRQGPKLRIVQNPAADVRLWFLDKGESELVQVQRDRFARNWRKMPDGKEYPHYRTVRERFREDLRVFEQFLESEGLPGIAPNHCEITYIDHIMQEGIWDHHGQFGKAFTFWESETDNTVMAEPDMVGVRIKHVLRGSDGEPYGRLHIDIDSAHRLSDNAPIYVMKSVARGRPGSPDMDSVMKFFNYGHDLIVKAFLGLTSKQLHNAWRPRR